MRKLFGWLLLIGTICGFCSACGHRSSDSASIASGSHNKAPAATQQATTYSAKGVIAVNPSATSQSTLPTTEELRKRVLEQAVRQPSTRGSTVGGAGLSEQMSRNTHVTPLKQMPPYPAVMRRFIGQRVDAVTREVDLPAGTKKKLCADPGGTFEILAPGRNARPFWIELKKGILVKVYQSQDMSSRLAGSTLPSSRPCP